MFRATDELEDPEVKFGSWLDGLTNGHGHRLFLSIEAGPRRPHDGTTGPERPSFEIRRGLVAVTLYGRDCARLFYARPNRLPNEVIKAILANSIASAYPDHQPGLDHRPLRPLTPRRQRRRPSRPRPN